MHTLVLLVAITLTGVASAAGNAFNPVPDGSPFNYFMGTCGRAVERTAYYSLAVVDGVLTPQILSTNAGGALTHKISEQKKCPTSAEMRQSDWPKAKKIEHERVYAQSPVLAGFPGKTGVSALDNGWAVTHADVSMSRAIAAYENWFGQAGLTLTPTASTSANIAPYHLTGLADDLRVVFHREGSGVRVYIGAR